MHATSLKNATECGLASKQKKKKELNFMGKFKLFLNVWVEDNNRPDQHSYKVLPVEGFTFIKSEKGIF